MKRKYLQGKRGIEKPPWELPDFIKDTGIMEMRDAVKEKENAAGLKSKMKEKVAPKMGKLDIDYQKLHDAFFRFQTRGKYTMHGELYYEGKEFETKLKEQKPGQLSEDLKEALNMPPLAPPPWLINMQRYGPPPSYPNLKIPGLNAPIPEGAQWGYHPGGWGRPPVDEYNRPLYGDVFGVAQPTAAPPEIVEPVDKQLWGELDPEEEYEEESEEEEEEEEGEEEEENQQDEAPTTGTDELNDGLATPSGMQSIASGLETPDHIELRKDRKREDDDGPKQLYQVLPEVSKNISGFMGSQHGYDLTSVEKPVIAPPPGRQQVPAKRKANDVDVAIDPSELESGLDEATLRAKYEAQMRAKLPSSGDNEDLSDMYAEHASRQAKKAKASESRKEGKKKEFKF
ncbi:Splicing factor 3B subunit 2 [Choanephora cucurbitarum]|uniref:Splicing factor 3B subunit 2 n=1 Tax=Choanephora cucurbitarum TaxID=101091 RepID=A0A1C7N235_9FUNG|nr:Splicing factor 3B subunit 2 [Choanephora cucurbitarum]